VLSCPSLTEKRIEGVVTAPYGFIAGHLTVRLDSMLQTEELPARISNLHTSLADMDANALTHCVDEIGEEKKRKEE